MADEHNTSVHDLLAERLRAARSELTARWLDRIVARVSVPPGRIFPSDDLLDHMPMLIEGIAAYLQDPGRPVTVSGGVVDRARELGALRYAQGFSEHELHKEYELLGGVLHAFLQRMLREGAVQVTTAEALECAHRLFQAIALIQQATTGRYLEHASMALLEREERLQAFHRALTHEIRNRVAATLGAGQLLQLEDLEREKRAQLAEVIVRNANGMRVVLDNLLELSRVRVATRQQRNVRLPDAAAEAARQLREAAAREGVTIKLSPELPPVEVNAAAVELCLANLISNGIKYADSSADERWVEVRGRVAPNPNGDPCDVVVEVADNGLGVPEPVRGRLFERFFRAHESAMPEVEGTGLGLNIVRDVLTGIGGRVWVEFPEKGSIFAFSMPCRRAEDLVVLSDEPVPSTGSEDGAER
jgi:signal transduction histidine kinase